MPSPRFTPKTLSFLRALKRHNDREWFKARKAEYERDVRAPMVAVIERLSDDFRGFAPELVASERVSLYRVYRDTRFSADKTPLKTHIAANFPWQGLPKHEGASTYQGTTHDSERSSNRRRSGGGPAASTASSSSACRAASRPIIPRSRT